MTVWFEEALDATLRQLDSQNRRRRLRSVALPGARLVLADGRSLIDVSSNDYLGLSQHRALKTRAIEWVRRFGAGARASRLVSGTLESVLELESRLAEFKGTEAALIFNAGYQVNATVLPALFELAGGRDALVFTDKLNHSSLHAGCSVAGVRQIRFRHNDMDHLESLLAQHAGGKPCFIVTESVFSMDGDRADVQRLATLATNYNAVLYLDEAHATGVLGPAGRGLAASIVSTTSDQTKDQAKDHIVVMGTLGKAMGSAGAYIAGSKRLIDFLVNRCSGFIYSTAPTPAACGAVEAALELIPRMDVERELLVQRSQRLRQAFADLGIDTRNSSTHIIPAVLGDEAKALAAQQVLEDAGILAIAIRPPTVPEGLSRLRFSLSSAHTAADFERVLSALALLKP